MKNYNVNTSFVSPDLWLIVKGKYFAHKLKTVHSSDLQTKVVQSKGWLSVEYLDYDYYTC